MFERIFVVKYITLKKGFCYLSPNVFKELQGNSIKLNYGSNKEAYFSVDSPNPSIDDNHIGINSLYAKALGIKDKESVTLTNVTKLPTISSLTISPTNQDDYHVLEMVADNVQSTLLNQIRVLNNDQKIVIWIGAGLYMIVEVYDIKPISPGFIDNFTEVTIKPPVDQQKITDENSNVTKLKSFFNFFNRNQSQQAVNNEKNDIFRKFRDFKPNLILRTIPNTGILKKIKPLDHPFNIFTKRLNQINSFEHPQVYLGKFLINSDQQNATEEKQLYFRLYYFEDFLHKKSVPKFDDCVYINDEILNYFNCEIGTRILLEPYQKNLPIVDEIELTINRKNCDDIKHIFRQYLVNYCEQDQFILNKNFPLCLNDDIKFSINFQPANYPFCLITDDFIRNYKIIVNDSILTTDTDKNKQNKLVKFDNYTLEMSNYKNIVKDSLFVLLENSKLLKKFDNVLITGGPGTGKTTLLRVIENYLKSNSNYVFTKLINCKTIKGKTIESLYKFFTKILYDLIHNQPSILILDDLNVLCENINEGDSQAQNILYFNRISEMLEGLLEIFCQNNSIGIVATSPSTLKLNKIIYGSRGHHLFKNTYEIENLSKKDREIILKYLFKNYTINNQDLIEISERTESFVVEDLANFAKKTLFESLQDNDGEELKITLEHMERGLESTTVTSLDGIKLNPPGTKDFSDIGGVDDVKNLLIETLLWPSKYPELFSGSPLRLPSGLLLYGPPGTGKTILAGAAATHCRLRLISIKGPELLSKYIGASEQAVRNVFEKAQAAKPCLLFFDEFDSLAPRRGHDNTGVTDRVVNQLLTQLDGVESSSSGVFVVAATSRPDLLDPALLRPGRLDRHIFIDLPNEENRLKILQCLSKTLEFQDGIDLSEIAKKTDGFSGADLQSLLYTAQLMSVEDVFKDGASSDDCHNITQQQLDEALVKTRPSLSPMERLNYQRRYKKFEGGGEDFQAGTRATLA